MRTLGVGGLTFGNRFLATFVDHTERQARRDRLHELAKLYNDTDGHPQGDTVAALLHAASQRSHDLVARYGGEEFVCLMPECEIDDDHDAA